MLHNLVHIHVAKILTDSYKKTQLASGIRMFYPDPASK